jgi:GT2 family glycosyltransferase
MEKMPQVARNLKGMNSSQDVAQQRLPKVAISILNWNRWRDTIECLESVRELRYTNYLTIVVDNGSWNDSAGRIAAWARERLGSGHVLAEYSRETALQGGEASTEQALGGVPSSSRLVVIRNQENLGFTGGNNVAIRYALERGGAADFVLFLNNDAVLEPACLTELVSAVRRANAGVVGAVTRDRATGELLFAGVDEKYPVARLFFPALFCWSRDLRHVEADFYPSLWVSGGAMLVRTETLVAVHRAKGRYLNPALFLYCDEAEFCWAARAEGYNVVVARKALAYHKGGSGGGGRLNSLFYYYCYRNRILLAKTLLPAYLKPLSHLGNSLCCLLRASVIVFRQGLRPARAILCGLYDGYRGNTGKWRYHDAEAKRRTGA